MKRLIFCFDGTWNTLTADSPTNVVLVAEMIKPIAPDKTPQIVYYDEGIGTSKFERVSGGAFGSGMETIIREAYRFLIFNYEPGDEIFAFGFSRGAYTARSFLGFIRHAGILDINSAKELDRAIKIYKDAASGLGDDTPDALEFRAKYSSQICVSAWDRDWRMENCRAENDGAPQILNIKYLGVWDSVAALGIPKFIPFATRYNRKKHKHDVKLTSKVQAARHAVAIDERRILFEPVLWNNIAELNADSGTSVYDPDARYQQRWFPGVHGSVGGGGKEQGLSDKALAWVLKGAKDMGLKLRDGSGSRAYFISPNPFAPLQNDPAQTKKDMTLLGKLKNLLLTSDRVGPTDIVNVAASARIRWQAAADKLPEKRLYRPKTLQEVAGRMAEMENVPDAAGLQIKAMQEHIVVRGDTLSKLSEHYLSDKVRWPEIFDANRDQIDDPDEIYVGMTLKIPKP